MHRFLALILMIWGGLSPAIAAVPAPPAELLPCRVVDGVETGACDPANSELYLDVAGRLGEGGSAGLTYNPRYGICFKHEGYGPDRWVPSPCVSAVNEPSVAGCAYIDVTNDEYVETSCFQALYAKGSGGNSGLVDLSGCGDAGNFQTYVYGGPSSKPTQVWTYRGPRALECEMAFEGERPDGLYGPTWVKIRASVDLGRTGSGVRYGFPTAPAYAYVPVDGDLRDLGPVAGFTVEGIEGPRVTFANASVHTRDEAMTYTWDFGDGATATAKDPTHEYLAPGTYEVVLTVKDASGDEAKARRTVRVDFDLSVTLSAPPGTHAIGDVLAVKVTVRNPFDDPVEGFVLDYVGGLRWEPGHLAVEGPLQPAPDVLMPGESVTFDYKVEPLVSGALPLRAGAQGFVGTFPAAGDDETQILVAAQLAVVLTTSITAKTKVGDTFKVTATVTNREAETVTGIKTEPLQHVPGQVVSPVSGPLNAAGESALTSPVTLKRDQSTTFQWEMKAEEKGESTLTANISALDPNTGATTFVSASKRIAVESPAIDVTFRVSPGAPAPGNFGTIRGTVENIGSVEATVGEYALTSDPDFELLEELIDPELDPRGVTLAPGKSKEFVLPFQMETHVSSAKASWELELAFEATVTVDGVESTIGHTAREAGGLDLNQYFTSFWAELCRLGWDGAVNVVESLDRFGDSSTLGGISVGSAQGCLTALQKLGDGLLLPVDLVKLASDQSVEGLTNRGKALVQMGSEYYNSTSFKQMYLDYAELNKEAAGYAADAFAGGFADWLAQVEGASARGDWREYSSLMTEQTANVGLSVTGEAAASQLWSKALKSKAAGQFFKQLMKAPDPDVPIPDERLAQLWKELAEDAPKGTPLSAGSAKHYGGLTDEQYATMAEIAKGENVHIKLRPRPPESIKWSEAGYNAKPPPVKQKSISDIDCEWLGYNCDHKGLVALRRPDDPYDLLQQAVKNGELEFPSDQVDAILERYNQRKAEWVEWVGEDTFDGQLVRSEKPAKKNEMLTQEFEVPRYGMFDDPVTGKSRMVKTKFTWDQDTGLLKMTHNDRPIYSDVDFWQIVMPNGESPPKAVYDRVIRQLEIMVDMQHGATGNTEDLPWPKALEFLEQYGTEHMRGGPGGPLLDIGPDRTVLDYVEGLVYPDELAPGTATYGQAKVLYESSAKSCEVAP